MDIEMLKSKAEGKWLKILTAITRIDPELLDGKHHPCPLCGGKDRFRVFDDFAETGGMICNQCHREKNGDGIASVQWLNECNLQEALHLLQENLAIANNSQEVDISAITGPVKKKMPIQFHDIKAYYCQTAAYPYRNEEGDLLFEVIRFEVKSEHVDGWMPKTFRQRKPDGSWSIKDVRRVPYALPEILSSPSDMPVFIVEGEKDANRLAELGVTATTAPGGAGNWEADWGRYFTERNVIILPDNDQPGRAHGERVANSLLSTARSVKLLQLPGLSEKGDVSDWLDAGGDHEQLIKLADATPEWNSKDADQFEFQPDDVRYFMENDPLEPDPILTNVFDRGDKLFIIGQSKARKSFFTLQLCLAIASGQSILNFEVPKPRRVLLLQYEIRRHHYWRRVHRLAEAMGLEPEQISDRLQILSLRGKVPKWEEIKTIAQNYDLVVIDPLYKILGHEGAKENTTEDVSLVLAHFDSLAEQSDAAVALVHHAAKGMVGDRSVIDRGAGSGVIARDYDACITLVPHESEKNAIVIESVFRNYPSMDPFTIQWVDGCFEIAADLSPITANSSNAWNTQKKEQRDNRICNFTEYAKKYLENGPALTSELAAELRAQGAGKNMADQVIRALGQTEGYSRWKTQTFPCQGMIGRTDSTTSDHSSPEPQATP